ELTPALPEDQAPVADERQVGLNVNLILRWEWRTGSTFYLVYAHQSSNDLTDLRRPLDFRGELGALNDHGVAHGDTLLVKVGLLPLFRGGEHSGGAGVAHLPDLPAAPRAALLGGRKREATPGCAGRAARRARGPRAGAGSAARPAFRPLAGDRRRSRLGPCR